MQEHGFNPWVRKVTWSRKWQPILVFLTRESHGERNLLGCSPTCKELELTEWLRTYTDTLILLWLLIISCIYG